MENTSFIYKEKTTRTESASWVSKGCWTGRAYYNGVSKSERIKKTDFSFDDVWIILLVDITNQVTNIQSYLLMIG